MFIKHFLLTHVSLTLENLFTAALELEPDVRSVIDGHQCSSHDCDDPLEHGLQLLQTSLGVSLNRQRSEVTSNVSSGVGVQMRHQAIELDSYGDVFSIQTQPVVLAERVGETHFSQALHMTSAAPQMSTTSMMSTTSTVSTTDPKLRRLTHGNVTAAAITGVNTNAAGDLGAFITACTTNFILILVLAFVFSFLRLTYPQVYCNNLQCLEQLKTEFKATFPESDPDKPTAFDWVWLSLGLSTHQAERCIGLDNALLLEFCNLCMKIMITIGIPITFILGPLHRFCGGDYAGLDALSFISMNNVRPGHAWMYYLHGLVTIAVSQYICYMLFKAQERFVDRREKWLINMPAPRAVTLLVEGIPEEYRSDKKLKEFFESHFDKGKVLEAHVVKYTTEVRELFRRQQDAEFCKQEKICEWEKEGESNPDLRPQVYSMLRGQHEDAIDYYSKLAKDLLEEVREARQKLFERANQETIDLDVNSSSGFVIFTDRRDKELAQMVRYTSVTHEWRVSVPPEPTDVRWSDLRHGEEFNAFWMMLGYGAVFGLYIVFVPICVGITNIAITIRLGVLQSLWTAFAPTVGLLIFLAFLPTVLLLIFHYFFPLKADAWAQSKLQEWYFWFMVFFVILVTAVGSSFVRFATSIVFQPIGIFDVLAHSLPTSTHFYLNYMVLQCMTHTMNLTRYFNLSKFIAFRKVWDDETARDMAEPEDQDYYGIGSRSARWAINMVIGIVFGTISPLTTILTFFNFFICRLVYGYLMVYAETKKPDLGGVFWVTSLRHVHTGVVIYCILMTGILAIRAPDVLPTLLGFFALIGTGVRLYYFHTTFAWEHLAFNKVTEHREEMEKRILVTPRGNGLYVQPELVEN